MNKQNKNDTKQQKQREKLNDKEKRGIKIILEYYYAKITQANKYNTTLATSTRCFRIDKVESRYRIHLLVGDHVTITLHALFFFSQWRL